ncbi:MAG TPA: WD40 repeat domain-containing protein [Fimbriimonadaceae bacterium]|nr:WD40 repeat domain-containing protein [Fimbriimonadaceae bacterium]
MRHGAFSTALTMAVCGCAVFARGQSSLPDVAWLAGGHYQPIVSVAYSPDGSMIGSSGHFSDSTIKLWRESDGSLIRTLNGSATNPFIFGPMTPVTFLRDGKTVIAIGEGSSTGYWNVADGRLLKTTSVGGNDLALDPTGTLIAAPPFSGSSVRIVHASDGTPVRTLSGAGNIIERVAFSPDGTRLAGGDANGRLLIWRVSDGTLLTNVPGHTLDVSGIQYSPDGTMIATASYDQTVKLWDAATGTLIRTLTGHTAFIECMKISPDGHWLASGSDDDTVRLYSLPSGTFIATISTGYAVNGIAFNPTSTRMAVAGNPELREYDVAEQMFIRSLVRAYQPVSCARFAPDGRLVTAGYDGVMTVHDVSGAEAMRIGASLGVMSLAVAPDGQSYAAGMQNQTIRHYRMSDGALLHSIGVSSYIYGMSYSPDGATLATGHLDNTVRLWNTSDYSLRATLNGHSSRVTSIAFTSDGTRMLTASADGTVRVWDGQGNFVRVMTGTGEGLNTLAISPDNQFVLAGGEHGILEIWRISTGQLAASLGSGQPVVAAVCYTPSGYAFYSAGQGNSTVKVWRANDHALLETYTRETGGISSSNSGTLCLDVSPDGAHMGFGRDDATVVFAYNTLISVPASYNLVRGSVDQGTVQDLAAEDGSSLVIRRGIAPRAQDAPVQIELFGQSRVPNPTSLAFTVKAGVSTPGLQQEVWMFNFHSGSYEQVDARAATVADQTTRVDLGANFGQYLDGSGNFRTVVQFRQVAATLSASWRVSIDRAVWSAGL